MAAGALAPICSFFCVKLTGQMAVDYTIAARTLVFDQQRLQWSTEILNELIFLLELFPPVFPGGTAVGKVTAKAAS